MFRERASWIPQPQRSRRSPSRGTVTVQGLTIRYTPNPGETSGVDSFVYRACDNGLSCDTATVTLTLAVT